MFGHGKSYGEIEILVMVIKIINGILNNHVVM
jgi:hypothetical protein